VEHGIGERELATASSQFIIHHVRSIGVGSCDGNHGQWPLPDLVAELERLGLIRPRELLARPIANHLDPREHRRVEMALRLVKLLAHVQRRELEADNRSAVHR
jgi:hypothetical protein